jgi:hypothetical protein
LDGVNVKLHTVLPVSGNGVKALQRIDDLFIPEGARITASYRGKVPAVKVMT